ncbi:unnamed protein product, partial [Didymodactylos carnosus]
HTNECPIQYQATDIYHSYCLTRTAVETYPVTKQEKQMILNMHNNERLEYWNDDLAIIAQKYADYCYWDHDLNSRRIAPRLPVYTGQNLAGGRENWTLTLQDWINEKQHYYYDRSQVTAHYSQVIDHADFEYDIHVGS